MSDRWYCHIIEEDKCSRVDNHFLVTKNSTYVFLEGFIVWKIGKLGDSYLRRLVRPVRDFPEEKFHLRQRSPMVKRQTCQNFFSRMFIFAEPRHEEFLCRSSLCSALERPNISPNIQTRSSMLQAYPQTRSLVDKKK